MGEVEKGGEIDGIEAKTPIKMIEVGDIPAGETPEEVGAVEPEIITTADIPAGPAESEVQSTGTEFKLPEPSVEQARADVKAAAPAEVTPGPTVQPRNTDVTGYNAAEGYKGARVSDEEQQTSADAYVRAQGYPTSGEKAATLADQSKSGWRKLLDRFRG